MEAIGIVANCYREAAIVCARSIYDHLKQRGVPIRVSHELARALKQPELGIEEEALGNTRLLVALGGDGTLLMASHLAFQHGVPILGVHVGGPASFGFLTETTPAHAHEAVDAFLAGHYHMDERLMVRAEIWRDGARMAAVHGLNEIVIREQVRMLKFRVTVQDTFIATYAADGIIVATPTGSTAYNLAAGGPIVHPSVGAILLTPICPHTLNVRSLLVDVDHNIEVELARENRGITQLAVDGRIGWTLKPGDVVRFSRSEYVGRFVALNGDAFYQKVQTRLRLGERFGS